MTTLKKLFAVLAFAVIPHQVALASAPATNSAPTSSSAASNIGVDPLQAEIDARDTLRFALLMKANVIPSPEILQRDYLDGPDSG